MLCGAEAFTRLENGDIALYGKCEKLLGHWPKPDRFHAVFDEKKQVTMEWCGPTEARAPVLP